VHRARQPARINSLANHWPRLPARRERLPHSLRLSSSRIAWGFSASQVTAVAKRLASSRLSVARIRLSSAVSRRHATVSAPLGLSGSDAGPSFRSTSPDAAAEFTGSGATLRLSMSSRTCGRSPSHSRSRQNIPTASAEGTFRRRSSTARSLVQTCLSKLPEGGDEFVADFGPGATKPRLSISRWSCGNNASQFSSLANR